MKKLILISLLLFGYFVQGQSPQLNVKGKDSTLVRLSQLKVTVKVVGNIAYTTSEMHFFNGTNRQMEAELLFPLPEGVSVSRYAIDINGKMREAVPVNKNKGKQVFEAIEHRRVDPGLLEKVEGNNFRTRIYPLMPGKERIIIIGYEQELSSYDATHLAYQMVTNCPNKLDVFELKIAVLGATSEPNISNDEGILALENINQTYQTSIVKNNFQPKDKLLITIPINQEIPSIAVQSVDGQHYFYANTVLDNTKIKKKNPNTIGLIWDVSLSCKNRNTKREFQLLDEYFSKLQNVEISLYLLSYDFERKNNYTVKNGDWSVLKSVLESTAYDGGTRFSKIKLPAHDEYLFFTDGLSSLSSNIFTLTKKPIYTISSMASSDYAFLNYNAIKTGGCFLNLNEINLQDALDKLQFQTLKFLGIKENYLVTDLFPMVGTPVSGSFSVAGISLKNNNEITLLFGYDSDVILEKTIVIDATNQVSNEISIERLWAQKKIANLEIQYKLNASEIETLGKRYGIITQNTSLIVLENLNDYIQYDIVPPAELRPEFDRIMKQQVANAQAKKFSNWQNIESYYQILTAWWNKNTKYEFPKPEVKSAKLIGTITGVVSDNSRPIPGANVVIKGTNRGTQTDVDGRYAINVKSGEVLVFSFVGFDSKSITIGAKKVYNVQLSDNNSRLDEVVITNALGIRRNDDSEEENDENVRKEKRSVAYSTTVVKAAELTQNAYPNAIQSLTGKISGLQVNAVPNGNGTFSTNVSKPIPVQNQSNSQISTWASNDFKDDLGKKDITKVNKWNPDRIYLKALANAPMDKKYDLYLQLRDDQINNPSFYFDVANHFYDNGNKEKALLILSNIADLGLENHQLYKSLTYLLRQWESYEDALFTATQVAKWRDQEPQAHRDLALTLEDNKEYQAAFDELLKALDVNYFAEMSGQYDGVEDIILMDINRLVSEHKNIKIGKLDKKYLKKMPVSMRIILNWNQMDIDIDLHVVEPTNEECFYGHRDTEIGARFSKDFTQGYGPEQYLVRNAAKGKYILKTNYFGESALTENGPTTVMVEIYTTKANGSIERKLQTIQLGKVKQNENLAVVVIE
ncbi:VIT domain-containing protein [Flavobacterium sp.]|uniref:VIT domain-containing protein n=1 Tax=Flavobacterium sp. TaxID=239 RepID=UPI0037511137